MAHEVFIGVAEDVVAVEGERSVPAKWMGRSLTYANR